MKSFLSRVTIIIALISSLSPARAWAEGEGPNDGPADEVLAAAPNVDSADAFCPPGVYSRAPELCPAYGPAAANAQIKSVQLPTTVPHLKIAPIDHGREAILNYAYARVIAPNAPVFASAEDALAGTNPIRAFAAGFVFVSLLGGVKDGQPVYQINPGQFMRAGDLKLYLKPPKYEGVQLAEQPTQPFGLVLRWFRLCRKPGVVAKDGTVSCDVNSNVDPVDRPDQFMILDKVKVGQWYWYMVGPDQWIVQQWMAVVTPAKPPEGVTGKWVDVNIYEQTVVAYDGDKMVYATLASTGRNIFPTRPGAFKIYQKLPNYKMSGAEGQSDYYYLEDIPNIMYFDEGRAFHATYWHDQFGYKRSRGCVNLSPRDAKWLFNWADVGTWVNVHDPSGKTPTDPAFYGFSASP